MTTDQWPDSLPILTADDICSGKYFDNGKSCLLGWISRASRRQEPSTSRLLTRELCRFLGDGPVGLWNDTHTLQECADKWNEFVRELGYTEIVECERWDHE